MNLLRYRARVVRLALCLSAPMASGQGAAADANDPEPLVKVDAPISADRDITQRLEKIYAQIETLGTVTVTVQEGVVTLGGSVANERYAERATDLAIRLAGVVTVEDQIERTLDVESNLRPVVSELKADVDRWVKALPLVLLSLLVFAVIAFVGSLLAGWKSLWERVAPNRFLASLLAQTVRVVSLGIALVVALNLIGATALMGTILGSAGVIGLAIGFAVRDTLENYISSIMLSLRQPFRANDHVVIDSHEGKVVRLTSRATVLMTLDGNQLRIPNSQVFKAVILNYTRNPERRFDFELGVDANDDPLAAMQTGLDAIKQLDFILEDPAPAAVIKAVGDSNVVLLFLAWVNQRETSLGKARSLAIRAVTTAIEASGFTLPEPIYRLRFDAPLADAIGTTTRGAVVTETVPPEEETPPKLGPLPTAEAMDVKPETDVEQLVNDERSQDAGENLLDNNRPIE
ncbi:MAG: mechanosensitive ion channel family protein [Gammaproteobacteria bacterium]